MSNNYIWLDVETTGLSIRKDHLLEVGYVATRFDPVKRQFSVLAKSSMVIKQDLKTSFLYLSSSPEVRKMHTENGLWTDLMLGKGASRNVVAETLDEAVRFYDAYENPLCGSGVGWDRIWVRDHLHDCLAEMTHKVLDVSSISAFFNMIGGTPHPEIPKAHRPIEDCLRSIEIANFHFSRLPADICEQLLQGGRSS